MNNMNNKLKDKEQFIQKYSDLHEELSLLENEIEKHLKNKSDLLCDDNKLIDLSRRAMEAIELLESTRKEERIIFNYGTT